MAKDVSSFDDLPSAWLERFSRLITPKMHVLEIASGNGRNTRFLAQLGCRVTAVDMNPMPLVPKGVEFMQHDLENEPWPFEKESFDVVVGINYLWRRRFGLLCQTLKSNGLLIYETFNVEQSYWMGKPKNPELFLKIGELVSLVDPRWRILAFEDGMNDRGQSLQRIVARKCMLKNMLAPELVRIASVR